MYSHIKTAGATLLVLGLLNFFGHNALAGSKAGKTIYSSVPFDASAEKLPPYFAGNNIESLFKALNKKEFRKDPYESVAEYQERVKQPKRIIGSIDTNSLLAFADIEDRSGHKYDPEKRELSVFAYRVACDNGKHGLIFRKHFLKAGQYIGANAFGYRTVVNQAKPVLFSLCYDKEEAAKLYEDDDMEIRQNIPMSPSMARHEDKNVAFLFLARLVSPYAHSASASFSPTIDDPTEISRQDKYVYGRIQELWIYNYRTGDIYRKIKIAKDVAASQ